MKIFVLVLVTAMLIIAIIIGINLPKSSPPETQPQTTNGCTGDSDCVAATCCHSDSCVLRQNAPDCKGVMCTMECRPGTMDCGGGCICDNSECNAAIPS